MLGIKLGQIPQWKKDGQLTSTTLIQVQQICVFMTCIIIAQIKWRKGDNLGIIFKVFQQDHIIGCYRTKFKASSYVENVFLYIIDTDSEANIAYHMRSIVWC